MLTPSRYETIGPDRPLGDRDELDEETVSPEEIERISNEDVKNPADGPEIEGPDDPSKD